MCLVLFGFQTHPRYSLVLASNRDEFHDRKTSPLYQWERAGIVAGRDEEAGGTWLGMSPSGRVAWLTNYRESQDAKGERSRGELVCDYLATSMEPRQYLQSVKTKMQSYAGFNLVVGTKDELFVLSNRCSQIQSIPPGVHGLSNHLLNTIWPKVKLGSSLLSEELKKEAVSQQNLVQLMQNQTQPTDAELPETGVGLDWERTLAPIFIKHPEYGTRSTTVLTLDHAGGIEITELRYDRNGQEQGRISLNF